MNQMYRDEALNETNATVPSDSADDARIENNCLSELLPELEPPELRRAILGDVD
jgi:hypothetical protein